MLPAGNAGLKACSTQRQRLLLGFGGHDGADELDEAGGDAHDQADQVEPFGVQPAVQAHTDEPANESGRRQNHGELAVAGDLDPEAALLSLARLVGVGFAVRLGHTSDNDFSGTSWSAARAGRCSATNWRRG